MLNDVDRLIRAGKVALARKSMGKLSRAGKLKDASPAGVANLFWRIGEPARGLRALSSVFPDLEDFSREPEAAAEYAACLIWLGAPGEAQWILERVEDTPKASLYRGLAAIETWDYAESIAHFTQFIATPKLGRYWTLIGHVNLASALVYERRHAKARPLLRGLLHDTRLAQNVFALGYALELAAYDRIGEGEYASARRLLHEADARWKEVDGLDRFYLEKWMAICDLFEDGDATGVESVKERATAVRHWETVRDCDRYLALKLRDEARFRHLIFGTPYASFRGWLTKEYGRSALPKSYDRVLGNGRGPIVDLTTRNSPLLSLLASDFYKPQRLPALFAGLFPDEHFRPRQSSKRVHEMVRRLNARLRSDKVSLRVREEGAEYSLEATGAVTLRMPQPGESLSRPLLTRLREHFGDREFATREALGAVRLPRRTLVRQLQSLVVGGHLRSAGKGIRTRYRTK